MRKTLVELRAVLQLFHCSVLKIFTLSLRSLRVRTVENCCLFAEIFNILFCITAMLNVAFKAKGNGRDHDQLSRYKWVIAFAFAVFGDS